MTAIVPFVHSRLAALAASAFLINLNVAVVDRACGSRHDTAPTSEHTEHEHHAPSAPTAPQHEAPAKCCDAISSCGVTLSMAGDLIAIDDAPAIILVSRSSMDSPRSLARAPEPPPPKA